jgi:hypothetical protein
MLNLVSQENKELEIFADGFVCKRAVVTPQTLVEFPMLEISINLLKAPV